MNTDALIRYALDALHAEDTGEGLLFQDSFGELLFTATVRGLRSEDGALITTQQELRQHLRRPGGINTAGLQEGTILTVLGELPFSFSLQRAFSWPRDTAHRVILSAQRPWLFGNVWYDALHVTNYFETAVTLYPGYSVRRQGQDFDLAQSSALRSFLYDLGRDAMQSLLTPEAKRQARRGEITARLEAARKQAREAQLKVEALELELLAVPQAV